VLLIAGCGNKSDKAPSGETLLSPEIVNNPATASGETAEAKLPVFEFTEATHDFGSLSSGDQVTHTFEFTNTGNADLVITQVKPSCGCTSPSWSKEPVKPGEKGKIEVGFNSTGMAGQVTKTITILANTQPTTKVLTISAEVLSKK
jgi:hypothetical protein